MLALLEVLNVLRNDLGYFVPEPQIINAKDFGVPQHRERIIIVAVNKSFSHHKFDFSFHDLRATFGMNMLDNLMPLVNSKEMKLSHVLIHIKERMGHSSLSTTEKYLNFRDKHKIKKQAQDNYENYLESLINE